MNLFRLKDDNSTNQKFNERALVFVVLVLACFGLSQTAQAVTPAPDGGYPDFNTAEGDDALFSLTTGVGNAAIGTEALFSNTTGTFNTATGVGALLNNTTASNNTATGAGALFSNTTIGVNSGGDNTATGFVALYSNTTGTFNTASGSQALGSNTTGFNNTATGAFALSNNRNGVLNTAIGVNALLNNSDGQGNIALGFNAGISLTTGNFNIDIGHPGVVDEAQTIRIGNSVFQTRAFIAGIRGVTTGNMNATAVVIDSLGQLGTVSSSRRFKNEIKPMDQTSEAILGLKPVTFHYKSDTKGTPQFGLIAEEVAAVNPDLVVRDENGEIYSVRYDAVNAMLLNEFLKEHRRVQEQEATITQLKSTVAQQQKGMEVLTATLKDQAAQIKKVSAQVEMSRPAPQTVDNGQ